jgi:hypothetical protein
MKCLFLNVIILSLLGVFSPQVVCADSGKPVVIESIIHSRESEVKEVISFKFTAPLVPEIFTLDGEKPRLVLDFPQSIYMGKNIILLPESELASAIRIGLHQKPVQKTRVVVDLSKKPEVQYSSEYSEQDNALLVVLTSDTVAVEVEITVNPDLSLQGHNASSGQDNNLFPAPADNSETEISEPAAETLAEPLVPMIHEISFDDSSSKGEMVLFHLNDFFPPLVSAIEKDSPRVICDFMATNLSPNVQKNILANGNYVEQIRIVEHQDPEKIQVVVDLYPDQDYDLQQVFFRKDNLFVLIINKLVPENVE